MMDVIILIGAIIMYLLLITLNVFMGWFQYHIWKETSRKSNLTAGVFNWTVAVLITAIGAWVIYIRLEAL